MLKKYMIIGLLLLIVLPSDHPHAEVVLPPLPNVWQHKNITAIVTLAKPLSATEIRQVTEKYRNIQVRKIYKHALTGFSVSGPEEEVFKLQRESGVHAVSEVSIYHAQLAESIPFVGADHARSYFDENKQRITGKGVTVGIIDTGIDYTHPDLRRSYKSGRDLVDLDNDPMETKGKPELATFHGTHVAGIIAANGKMKGIAPEANIIAYRALGPGGFGDSEQVLAAIDAAMEDQVDVLNLSLGNNVNGPDLPISLALNKAVDSGIVAVTSNGNSGPGIWTVGSPGTAEKAISVGASTPPMKQPYLVYGLGTVKENVRLAPLQGSKNWDLHFSQEVVDGGIGTSSAVRNVKGKVVLIERGTLTFTEKARNAEKAGAKAVIIYNNSNGVFTGSIEETLPIPVVAISKKQGENLKAALHKKRPLTVHFITKKEQDQLAEFSSRGPVTVNWGIKPDLLAPGVNIDSTIPSGYLALQGTSMAAPHVAGACALILQAHPDWTPEEVKSALMSSAKPLKNKAGRSYRTYEQGAGRLQIEKALQADTLLSKSSFAFGMYTNKEGTDKHSVKLTIKNASRKEKRYSFKQPNKQEGMVWDFPPSFQVSAEETKTITIGLQVNPVVMKKGIYDGYFSLLEGSNVISLPFLYVKEEPDYPRVMGFEFKPGDQSGMYRYEMYLPMGADEFGVAIYDLDSLRFIEYIDYGKNASQGIIEKELPKEKLPESGIYKAVIYAKKSGKEDQIETIITIN